jgi:hypothetical protein
VAKEAVRQLTQADAAFPERRRKENKGEMLPSIKEEIITLEKRVWEAVFSQDVAHYQALVADDALMVIGGMRSTGAQEAQVLEQIKFPAYELSEFQVIVLGDDIVLLHYTATFTGGHSSPSDFSGSYYVSSIWKRRQNGWQLVFNQDVRPAVEAQGISPPLEY